MDDECGVGRAERAQQGRADRRRALEGRGADRFEKRTGRLDRQLRTTAATGAEAGKVVAGVTQALDGGHTAATRLLDEYLTKASRTPDAGISVSGSGSQAALMKAVASVSDMVPLHTKESAQNLRAANTELTRAAKKLKSLERDIGHDGIGDPGKRKQKSPERESGRKDDKKTSPSTSASGRGKDIVSAARKEIGVAEKPPGSNRNPYGPTAAWCSSFATSMWRKAGVKIPVLPFTGDVYQWGQQHGKAYGKNSLDKARPGDVLLFGTGPGSPSTSTHIGIVEKVEGDRVTLIEGNSGDKVQRNTHTLSSETFYGGVHP
ncbi:CHAP domain-containing protein [Amycolatopsis antarctica]|uniref:CHAP domain-containing protein n=1 Tax=Amycolatopsis antarctica TaxID=1854586 RepID=UPI001F0AEDF5|nr:CHAP domain-containing protein [Amycolatopsis antarctica]